MMKALTSYLAPFSTQRFLDDYWTKKVFVQRGDKDRYKDLFNWNRYNKLLDEHIYQLLYPDIRLVHQNRLIEDSNVTEFVPSRRLGTVKKIDPKAINYYCQHGATLVLDAVNRIDYSLGKLCEELAVDFKDKVQINAYCSWVGTQGFDVHYDLQEVFIMQVEGRKDWAIYEDIGTSFPINKKNRSSIPKDVKPSMELTLNQGDLLYIPRGIWHSAIAKDEPSLHLTLGVYVKSQVDLIKWFVTELIENDMDFRKNLRDLKLENTELELNDFVKIIESFKDKLSKTEILPNQVYNYHFQDINKSNRSQYFNFPFMGMKEPIDGPQTKFYRPTGQIVHLESLEDGEGMRVICEGKVLVFRGEVKDLVTGIFSQYNFDGHQVHQFDPEFEWEDIKAVLQKLVREQILYIQTSSR